MTTPLNPYVAGNPVGGSDAFVGRSDVLREVLRVLRRPKDNALVLYGQRRIGKTSILEHLAAWLPRKGPYRPVYFDLQDKAAWPLGRVLESLAETIAGALGQGPPQLSSEIPTAFRETWLPDILASLPDGSSLVLLFDEFDVLAEPSSEQAADAFFPYLRDLLSTDPGKLQFIFGIGRNVDDLDTIALSLFKGTDARRVSLVSRTDTATLLRLSETNGTLHWKEEAVERVWQLTNGHPFLTQQLCSHVWERAYDEDPGETPTVGAAEIDAVIDGVLDASQNTLEWLWSGLPPAERIVTSALAEAGPDPITAELLEKRLHESGVRVVIRDLQNAPRQLEDWDILEPAAGGRRFRVELLRRWVVAYKPLHRVQEELDHIEPVAQNLYQAALGLYRRQKLDEAVALLRQALNLNPNHQGANQLLAEILLAQGELVEAREILERFYAYQPAAARPRLVQVLLLQAQQSVSDADRLPLYEQVLDIDPGQREAHAGKASIWLRKGEQALRRLYPWNPLDHLRLFWWILAAPRRLVAYRKVYPAGDEYRVGRWLQSTFLWLPAFLPTLAVGLGRLPLQEEALSPQHVFLWISGSIVLAWALWGVLISRSSDWAGVFLFLVCASVSTAVGLGLGSALTGPETLVIGLAIFFASCWVPSMSKFFNQDGVADEGGFYSLFVFPYFISIISGTCWAGLMDGMLGIGIGIVAFLLTVTVTISAAFVSGCVSAAMSEHDEDAAIATAMSIFLAMWPVFSYTLLIWVCYFKIPFDALRVWLGR